MQGLSRNSCRNGIKEDMDLKHARTFLAVGDLGSVSRAAVQLRIAQPALSRQLHAFESELSLKLFDRVGRRLVLTAAGEQLMRDCRNLLNHAAAVEERAKLLQREDSGVLRVGGSPQHIESVLAPFLHIFARRFPDVEVRLVEAAGVTTMRLLERGEIHLGQNLAYIVDPAVDWLGIQPLHHVDLLAAFHPSLPLGRAKSLEVSELAPFPLLLVDSSFALRRSFDAACRLAGLRPRVFLESTTPHTLVALAEAKHGIAIIPSQFRLRNHDLRIVGLTYNRKPLREGMMLLWDKRRPLPRYADAYSKMLAEHVRRVFPITRPSDVLR
ncbi:hypothetical protein BSZ21_04000 [Bradyrhizobium canariense]|nr:hypothetical protein BSZ21_04000 [Bradyrhizobium canariense]